MSRRPRFDLEVTLLWFTLGSALLFFWIWMVDIAISNYLSSTSCLEKSTGKAQEECLE